MWWIKHLICDFKYRQNQKKLTKEHMKSPMHSFDFRNVGRVLIVGKIKGNYVICTKCGVEFWTSGKLNCEEDIGEYGMRGCNGR